MQRSLRRSRFRRVLQATFDSCAWAFGVLVAALIDRRASDASAVFVAACTAAGLQVISGLVTGISRGRWRVASFDELPAVIASIGITTGGLLLVEASVPRRWDVGWRMVVAAAFVAGGLMLASRYVRRWRVFRGRRPAQATPVVVFGAGIGGTELTAAMLRDPMSPYLPVALLDDDSRRRGVRVSGVKVVGGRDALEAVAARTGADTMLIAIPSASRETIAELADIAHGARLEVKVAPSLRELVGRSPLPSDVRDLDARDLLGRQAIHTSVDQIASYVSGRRVLVTGAGGSIGSELCRQLQRFGLAELIMLDRDESALHAVQLSIDGQGLLTSPDLMLADLRDAERIRSIIDGRRPEVVFHAAALKHLPLLEQHPAEAVRTNVWGTLDLLEIASEYEVARFVNVSTDKAANPTNVLGYSKRIGERLVANIGAPGTFLSVRFGNVLGSRGSSLFAFETQIAAGGPVTITDPDVTRYFMTIDEAVELVVQAGAIGESGSVMVLDMGEPIRIVDLVRRLIAQSGRTVPLEFMGLRPGEKLHEELFGRGEIPRPSAHTLISSVVAPPLEPRRVRALDVHAAPADLVAAMRALALEASTGSGALS